MLVCSHLAWPRTTLTFAPVVAALNILVVSFFSRCVSIPFILFYFLQTLVTITFVGGLWFFGKRIISCCWRTNIHLGLVGAIALVFLSYNIAKVYGHTSRDLRRLGKPYVNFFFILEAQLLLDSVTRSPLYSIYGEIIAGVAVIRAFGASTTFLREMFRRVDTNTSP